jgi:hypothetical protein
VGGLITLNAPLPFPELAAESTNLLASMYARRCDIKGHGSPVQGTKNITFVKAEVYVTFGNFPWTFQGIDFFQLDPTHPYIWAEQHFDFAAEFITIPGRQLKYATSGKFVQGDWGFFSPMMDFSISLKGFPYLPAAQILAALAKPINSVPYLNVPAGQLMFKGAQDHRTKASDGTQTADLTLAFSYRNIAPWDYNFDGSTGLWDQVVTFVGGNPVLQRSDLTPIIPLSYTA